MLEDDIKEYWGFYLLKDSTVKLSVCSRHEGASFIVVKVSCVKTLLPGFGNGWLNYCAIVQFWGGQRNILRVILET